MYDGALVEPRFDNSSNPMTLASFESHVIQRQCYPAQYNAKNNYKISEAAATQQNK